MGSKKVWVVVVAFENQAGEPTKYRSNLLTRVRADREMRRLAEGGHQVHIVNIATEESILPRFYGVG